MVVFWLFISLSFGMNLKIKFVWMYEYFFHRGLCFWHASYFSINWMYACLSCSFEGGRIRARSKYVMNLHKNVGVTLELCHFRIQISHGGRSKLVG
jgi:hypothetical protein